MAVSSGQLEGLAHADVEASNTQSAPAAVHVSCVPAVAAAVSSQPVIAAAAAYGTLKAPKMQVTLIITIILC